MPYIGLLMYLFIQKTFFKNIYYIPGLELGTLYE